MSEYQKGMGTASCESGTVPESSAAKAAQGHSSSPEEERLKRSKAQARVQAAYGWCRRNPDALEHAFALMLDDAKRGAPVHAQKALEQVRDKAFVDTHGGSTRVNNNHAPVIARLFAKAYPQHRRLLKLRHSIVDEVMGGGDVG